MDALSIVQYLHSEVLWLMLTVLFGHLLEFHSSFVQSHVDGSTGMVVGRDNNLFLENSAVFSWLIRLRILNRFALLNLLKLEALLVTQSVYH